ncbi:MAG: haloacid dehalogenase type II [Bacteroidota bacterium]
MLPPSIKAILFDAYGTLFDVRTLNQRLGQHFGDQAAAINTIWRRKQLEYTWLRALMQEYQPFSTVTAEALSFACESLGISFSESVKRDLVQGYYQLQAYETVLSQLPGLAERFYLSILSNADEAMLNAAVQNSKIETYFQAIYSVDRVKRYKPDPAVYEMARAGLGYAASEIVFVSSNTWDVAGAKSFGFHVCWLDHFGGTLDHLGVQPDHLIKNLSELK